jgi:hypothetical protein
MLFIQQVLFSFVSARMLLMLCAFYNCLWSPVCTLYCYTFSNNFVSARWKIGTWYLSSCSAVVCTAKVYCCHDHQFFFQLILLLRVRCKLKLSYMLLPRDKFLDFCLYEWSSCLKYDDEKILKLKGEIKKTIRERSLPFVLSYSCAYIMHDLKTSRPEEVAWPIIPMFYELLKMKY